MTALLFIFIAFTALFLGLGLLSMVGGSKTSKRYGSKLMVLRVVFQALALLTLLLIYLYKK